MASYIEGYCDPQMPPPYKFEGVRIWSFPLLASYPKVQALVDRYLRPSDSQNADVSFDPVLRGSGNHAVSSLVYMMVIDYGRMACATPPGSLQGYFKQKEYLFGIPVLGHFGGKAQIAFFCPYIFVDCDWSMICGNTVLGYPKQPAWFSLPAQGDYPILIDAPVMVKYSPETQQSWQRLADIRQGSRLEQGMVNLVNDVGEMIGHVFKDAVEDAAGDLAGDLSRHWPFGPIERLFGEGGAFPLEDDLRGQFHSQSQMMSYDIVQLKQFRNAQFPDQACYRSLLTCTSALTKISSFRLLGEPAIRLPSYASLDIAGSLGLFASPNGVIRPLMPYMIECDFSFVNAKEQPI